MLLAVMFFGGASFDAPVAKKGKMWLSLLLAVMFFGGPTLGAQVAKKASDDKLVYFTAGFEPRPGHRGYSIRYGNGDRLVFNKVITNVGNAYDNGLFVAPFAGVYEFDVHLVTPWDSDYDACAYLRKGDYRVGSIIAEDAADTFQAASISVILKLDKGDAVDVVANFNHGDGFEVNYNS